jgi:predicted Zn-ribbon and HTH transcriptional regulator
LPGGVSLKKHKEKEPFVPAERHGTIRREIISVLEGRTLSAKDISAEVRISEKEVYEHLEHIQKSLTKKEHHLTVFPAECEKCGFVFKKRERLKKPGKCPVCKSEKIREPLFSVTPGARAEGAIAYPVD